MTSAQGKALLQCLDDVCPSSNGGPCDESDPFYDPFLCNECLQFAQSFGGPCSADLDDCSADGP